MKRGFLIILIFFLLSTLCGCDADDEPYIINPVPETVPQSTEHSFGYTIPTEETEPISYDESISLIIEETTPPEERGFYIQEDICIDAGYVTLHYPIEWADYLYVDISDNGISDDIIFYAVLPQCETPLFTISIGGEFDYPIGIIGDKNESYYDIGFSWANLEENVLNNSQIYELACAMQEAVNYVIDNLATEEAFRN